MNSKNQTNGFFKTMGWGLGGTSLLLTLGAGGLELLVQQGLGQDVTTALLTLYLASWAYVLGIVGFLVLAVGWLVAWVAVRVKHAAARRYVPIEAPKRRHLEPPVLEDLQSVQQRVSSSIPTRLPKKSDDRNNAARVA